MQRTMRKVIGHLANGNLEYISTYTEERDVKRGLHTSSVDRPWFVRWLEH